MSDSSHTHPHSHPHDHSQSDHAHSEHSHNDYDSDQNHTHETLAVSAHHPASDPGEVMTIRALSGLSGDMFVAGLLCLNGLSSESSHSALGDASLDTMLLSLGLPDGCIHLERRSVRTIAGWGCRVELPHEHSHRTLTDIVRIIDHSSMSDSGKNFAKKAFLLLAEAEGRVHGVPPEDVHFHEVGALDSILDMCLASELYARLAPSALICGPLPLADGGVCCAHGWIPSPAPAVFELLEGVAVRGFSGKPTNPFGVGETVTPTALALLRAFGATFGLWPSMRIRTRALVYGTRVFEDAPNGALFACGTGVTAQ